MPIYDVTCEKCNFKEEQLKKFEEEIDPCPKCGGIMKRMISRCSFKLVYNNKTDLCDWDGNSSRYWDHYKQMKKDGLKPRIPQFDGDGNTRL